ncbi:phosphatidate cytidylyltransferase [Dongia soli]|uniref:Phosphatidate cytidylyltransferase n=1 Tax=Dongia soli TaxID=600628 RepID=A0ABU5E9W1_9PROT|nr:phosphatidate cytidylyltransferase [Dongia soli]MDY0883034.1 phosphatidate cytidylyltransferase [Dongia soli]
MAPPAETPHERQRHERVGQGNEPNSGNVPNGTEPASVKPLTSFQQRVASSAVLLPVALLALWLGGLAWAILIAIFGGIMAWEWSAICAERRPVQVAYPVGRLSVVNLAMVAVVILSLAVAVFSPPLTLPLWLVPLAGALAILVLAWPQRGVGALWLLLGILYVVPAALAMIKIRSWSSDGFATEIWIVALVVVADTGAYFAGRSIGGPKLAPRISPSKTWAGLAGAILSAALVGAIAATLAGRPTIWPMVLASGLLAVVEQSGDLFESFFKRHFGVKDSGRIIPGHGGVLDRVDGLMAVVLAVAAVEYVIGGGILEWL